MTYRPPAGSPVKNVVKSDLKVISPGGRVNTPSDPNSAMEPDMGTENVFDPRIPPQQQPPQQPQQPPQQKPSPATGSSGGKGERDKDKENQNQAGDSPSGDPQGSSDPGDKADDPSGGSSAMGDKDSAGKPGKDSQDASQGAGKTSPGDQTGQGAPLPPQKGKTPPGASTGPKTGDPTKGQKQGGQAGDQGGGPKTKGDMQDELNDLMGALEELEGNRRDSKSGNLKSNDSEGSDGDSGADPVADAPADSGLDATISEAVNAAADQLNQQAADPNSPGTGDSGDKGKPSASDVLSSMGAGNIPDVSNYVRGLKKTKLADDWRGLLKKLLQKAAGIKEEHSAITPSRRIEGQFGREIEKPAIRRVIISVDCSASMGPEQFRQVFAELKKLGSHSIIKKHMKKSEMYSFMWGSFDDGLNDPERRREIAKDNLERLPGKGFSENIVSQMLTKKLKGIRAREGTDFIGFHAAMLKVAPKPDMVMVMTDGEFWNETVSGEEAAVKRLLARLSKSGRLIWVLVGSRYKPDIRRLDPRFQSHTIEIRGSAK